MNRKVCYQLKHLDVLRKRVNLLSILLPEGFFFFLTRRILTSVSKHVNHSQHALLYGACIIFFEGGRGEKFPKSVPAQLTGNRREEFEQVFCTNQVLFLMLNNSVWGSPPQFLQQAIAHQTIMHNHKIAQPPAPPKK